ncbi:helix-turn-helix domain-containing protein [Nocardia higoensis]|uniref:helix-turn-helix domain-containing protein n=1 Tax=Nocardia higoensis TaxID=228599 RepID=UPI0002E33410|nr:helix-turn-helix domain-containing protein [Nocardia higoensis]
MADGVGGYRERPSRLDGAVVWTRTVVSGDCAPVLPDGSIDLLWRAGTLLVAGPDTGPHHPEAPPGTRFAGVRFHPGSAPQLLGVPAHELRDRRIELADLWPAARVRALTAEVNAAHDPAAALEAVALRRAAELGALDPLPRLVVATLASGASVAATAEAAGIGARALHRRSLAAFGYGPKTLARILRMRRALAAARAGMPLALAAAHAGYADQAHFTREVTQLAGSPPGLLIGGSPPVRPRDGARPSGA